MGGDYCNSLEESRREMTETSARIIAVEVVPSASTWVRNIIRKEGTPLNINCEVRDV